MMKKLFGMKLGMKKAVSLGLTLMMAASLAACGGTKSSASQNGDTIKIGVIDDATGNNAGIGQVKLAGYQVAVDEINAAGGIMGKQIELLITDGQSDNTVYQQMANKLIYEDKVDVVMGGLTSASREAIRPIMDESQTLYFYNEQYEGGVADHYTFCTSATPEQQIAPAFTDILDQYGSKVYVIAADYNFGQISAQWVEKYIAEYGGEIVGKEFIPLDVSTFSSTISNIEDKNPDVLVSFLVGGNHESFYEQWENAGLAGSIPIFTTVSICEQYEHILFEAPTMAKTYCLASYLEELDTDAAKAFTSKIREKYSTKQIPYLNMDVEDCYSTIYLYKAAVEKAGTTETEAVIQALESDEIKFEGPGGTVLMDGATHHCTRDMVLFYCNEKNELETQRTYPAIESSFLKYDLGVDIRVEDPCKQYTP